MSFQEDAINSFVEKTCTLEAKQHFSIVKLICLVNFSLLTHC